jgi:hypothetical protein
MEQYVKYSESIEKYIKKGTKVLLRKDSRYWGQSRGEVGEIYEIGIGDTLPYKVNWGRNNSNSYGKYDLDFKIPNNIKYIEIKKPDIDPYGEEEWGYYIETEENKDVGVFSRKSFTGKRYVDENYVIPFSVFERKLK